MRITTSQLRRIIKEEARRTMLNEVGEPPFIVEKVNQAIVDALCAHVKATNFTGVSQKYLDDKLKNVDELGRAIAIKFGGGFQAAAEKVIAAEGAPVTDD